MFQFEASSGGQQTAELYGTLPHRKKARSTANTPLRPQQPSRFNRSVGSNSDSSRASIRRAEGFSRLLEFTRQQVEIETTNSSEFDVTQSLPVVNSSLLNSIDEREGDNMNEDKGSSMDEFVAKDGELTLDSVGSENNIKQATHIIESNDNSDLVGKNFVRSSDQVAEDNKELCKENIRDVVDEQTPEEMVEDATTKEPNIEVQTDTPHLFEPALQSLDAMELESQKATFTDTVHPDTLTPALEQHLDANTTESGHGETEMETSKGDWSSPLHDSITDTRGTSTASEDSLSGQVTPVPSPAVTQELERREERGFFGGWIVGGVRAWLPSRAGLLAVGVAVAATIVWYSISGHFK